MKNLHNALLLKQLIQLKQLGYRYTDTSLRQDDKAMFHLPNNHVGLKKQANDCHLCDLSKSRNKVVFGEGNLDANIMFVGDVPGASEDSSGSLFQGRSGDVLTNMIEKVLEIKREKTYMANIVKCKPLGDHSVTAAQIHTCSPYLTKQIELVKPKVIIALGKEAYKQLTGEDEPLEKIHGIACKVNEYTVFAIHHPVFLLRNPSAKRVVFEDLKKIKEFLDSL